MYQVINTETNNVFRTYPHKLQACIWCWLNGFVCYGGRFGYFLDGRVAIRSMGNNETGLNRRTNTNNAE